MQIDYTKFAQVAGLKTPASARELMRVTKNKLRDEYGALSSGIQSTNTGTGGANGAAAAGVAKPKGTPRKRKTKAADGDDRESPAKKGRIDEDAGAGNSPVKAENGGDGEVDSFFG